MCFFDNPLDVPYVSQEDPQSRRWANDCGCACVRGLLLYRRGSAPTVDELSAQTSLVQNDNGLTCAELKALAASNGLILSVRNDLTLARIQARIDAGDPVLMLISYAYIKKRQNQADKLGHFVNVVGYTPSGDIIYNDPDYWGARSNEGYRAVSPRAEFEAAVKYSPAPFQGLV